MSFPESNEDYAVRLRCEAQNRTLENWTFPNDGVMGGGTREVRREGVVGAGVMGSGIAQWCAFCGFDVVLRDVQREFLERGMQVIRDVLAGSVRREKCTEAEAEAALGRIATTTSWDGFEDCDVVIEAIVEDVEAKRKLLGELERVVRPNVLLASNTSALPLEEIFAGLEHPTQGLGLHFFNPVNRMPLVEMIVGESTSEAIAARGLDFVKALGKEPVICRSSPGFLVTRVLFFYLNEACRLHEEGVGVAAIDEAMRGWGWPMGPMRLIDEVGVDVTDFIFGELARYFDGRFVGSGSCGRLLKMGFRGRKNGASSGFYTYEGRESALNQAVPEIAAEAHCVVTAEEIQERLMNVMVAEARRCREEGVIKTDEDVDFALLSGAGFPAARGGLMRWAREAKLG